MPSLPTDPIGLRLQQDKPTLRRFYLNIRKELSGEGRSLLDAALISNTVSQPCFEHADVVLCYYPVRGEPNILPLARRALELGKQVAFPICDPDSCTMTFHKITDLSQLVRGAYSIPEPSPSLPTVTDTSHALCIVPALSFDRGGYRLGYGKGYYDRYLSTFEGFAIGLLYSYFLSSRLPRNEFDRAVKLLITEGEVICPDETTE